jgi:hypothetical protein
VNRAELFALIAETARKYAQVMESAPVPSDMEISWDNDRKFVVVIARAEAAEKLLEHLNPVESV